MSVNNLKAVHLHKNNNKYQIIIIILQKDTRMFLPMQEHNIIMRENPQPVILQLKPHFCKLSISKGKICLVLFQTSK